MKKFKYLFFVTLFLISVNSFSQTPFSLEANVGANLPLGSFSDVYKTGVSAEAGLIYSVPLAPVDLTFTLGYDGFKYKNEYFTGLVTQNLGVGVTGFDVSWTTTVIPVMVGARLKLPLLVLNPYVSGEIGLHIMSFKDRFNGTRIIGNSTNPTTFQLNGATESGSETGFATAVGIGVQIPLILKLSLDANVKYNYGGVVYSKSYEVFRNNNSNFTTVELKNTSFMTFRIGAILSL